MVDRCNYLEHFGPVSKRTQKSTGRSGYTSKGLRKMSAARSGKTPIIRMSASASVTSEHAGACPLTISAIVPTKSRIGKRVVGRIQREFVAIRLRKSPVKAVSARLVLRCAPSMAIAPAFLTLFLGGFSSWQRACDAVPVTPGQGQVPAGLFLRLLNSFQTQLPGSCSASMRKSDPSIPFAKPHG